MPADSPSDPPFSERLKAAIDAFLERTQMSPTEFGRRVINDSSLYTRIKRGRPVNSHTIDAIEALINSATTPSIEPVQPRSQKSRAK